MYNKRSSYKTGNIDDHPDEEYTDLEPVEDEQKRKRKSCKKL